MKFLILCLLLLPFNISTAQLSGITWQMTLGGNSSEEATMAVETDDGGLIIGSSSSSGIGPFKNQPNLGSWDYWIIKLNSNMQIAWQRTIGSTSVDKLTTIHQLQDGGFILVGFSGSPSSIHKSENAIGSWDYWIVKLDANGNTIWDNTIGGTQGDVPYDVVETADGSLIICGYSESGISSDKNEPKLGGLDGWIIKLNASGVLVNQNTIGGSGPDFLNQIIPCTGGGFVVTGYSGSNASADKAENNLGDHDVWLVKLDDNLQIIWENTIGGPGFDVAYEVKETSDGDFVLAVKSSSGTGPDKNENSQGAADFWIFEIDGTGFGIEWQNTIGGSGDDHPMGFEILNDGGYLLGGYTASDASGDKSESSQGLYDYWVIRLDQIGNVVWENSLGGNLNDELWHIMLTSGGELLLMGNSASTISSDKSSGSLGGEDIWLVKHVLNPPLTWLDFDGDGFGGSNLTVPAFTLLTGFVEEQGDCNDFNPEINPGALETCNGIDDNCSGETDEGFTSCSGDFTFDSVVNIADFLVLSSFFGNTFVCPAYDLTNDGIINVSDFLVFTAAYGLSCQ